MGQENLKKEQKLFMYMVGTFQSSAWIALRKMKNQMTEKFEKNLEQASSYIELLDMLQSKTKGNVSDV
jgi:cellobiose-specific phosphotransferase system component IIA